MNIITLLRAKWLLAIFSLSTGLMFAQTTLTRNQDNPKKPEGKYAKLIQAVIDSYDQVEGAQTLQQEKILYAQKTSELQSKALRMNIPIQRINESGTISLLIAFLEEDTPLYYSIDNTAAAASTRADHLNAGGSLGLNLDGDDLTAHVWDGGPIFTTHQEFDGPGGNNRMQINDGNTTLDANSFHAMHVTGTIGASGFQAAAKGMASRANVLAHDWTNDEVEARAEAMSGMLLSNHSYGIPFESVDTEAPYFPGQYNSNSTGWDDIMYDYPFYLMVKSAGNDGNMNTGAAPLGGNSNFDKLTGNANAKNNLVIANGTDASVDANGNLISVGRNTSSSEGPTDDFRVKPDITGNGTGLYSSFEWENAPFAGDPSPGDNNGDTDYASISGTSMSAPNVTGTLLLLQEHHANVHGAFMRAATLKGLALHTADDVNGAGPDAEFGWGLLNAKAAAEAISNDAVSNGAIIEENTLTNGSTYSIQVQSDGVNPLLASISWTDPAGTPDNSTTANVGTPAIVHDLDITLSNGSVSYPWRLTGVNSNSNDANGGNGNLVDPFERVDITAPAGIYTLTVSHKGTLSVPQAYSLIVTGANITASTPSISFSQINRTEVENSDCSFTDVTIAVNIATAASENADVNFTINGSSTATTDVDFELLTNSVTFPSGSTTSQNMTVRIYEDDFIEANETVIIDFTVNANGGDAEANNAADTFTLTIGNDDLSTVASSDVTVYSEDFEDFSDWINTEAAPDNDGNIWNSISFSSGGFTGFTGQFPASETDLTVLGAAGDGTADPNNYLISPIITIPANTVNVTFDFAVAGFANPEFYSVYWSPNTSIATINGLTPLESRSNAAADTGELRSISSSSINDETGHFVIRHHNSDANAGLLLFDDLVITATVLTQVQTAANTGSPESANVNAAGTVNTTDISSGNAMVDFTNNQSDDYGCTTLAVNRAGNSAQSYMGSSSPNLVMDKSFAITPTNVITAGDTQITFYFTEAEIAGWEAATSLDRSTLVIGRENAGSIAETAVATIGSFNTDVTLTGNFASLSGTYYFGNAATFVATCTGITKTWNGASWVPIGAPDITEPAVINGNYNTGLHGNIDACSVTINTGFSLTVEADDYLNVFGNITVDGTLQVDHLGSVVQTDNNASVIKGTGATINVDVSTPGLKDRDFIIMGSPVDGTTRETTLSGVWKVLANTPGNFVPHPDVTTTHGTTFADNDGNDWNSFAAGGLAVGEGYIVRPVYDHGTTPVVYDYSFNEGTLNNGVVSRPLVYNGAGNPGGTPNVYANPYASAISTDAFLAQNTDVAAVYFWEHITLPSSAIDGYHSINFDMDDISIYNGVMGTPAANDVVAPESTPTNVMSTGQGFGVLATTNGTVSFNNSMRLTAGNAEMRTANSIVESLLFNVRNDEFGVGGYAGVAFTDFTTEGLDARYDTERITTSVSLYSHLEDGSEALAIQSRELFDASMQIPMGFVSQIDAPTEFTFSIANVVGEEVSQVEVYLLDTFTGVSTNLSESTYTFTSDKGQFDGRFLVSFTATLGTEQALVETLSVYPNPTSDVINIVSPKAAIENVTVYDMMGRTVLEQAGANQNHVQIDLSSVNSALYFVEINTAQGVITQRVVKN